MILATFEQVPYFQATTIDGFVVWQADQAVIPNCIGIQGVDNIDLSTGTCTVRAWISQ